MPPPPPQTPDHEEKSGQPLRQRPGQKAGDFIERDLWNLDEGWEEGSGETEASKVDSAPTDPAEKPAGSADDDTDQPAGDDPGKTEDAEESATPAPDEEPDDSAETIDSPTENQEDDWEKFAEKEASEPEAASPPAKDGEQEPVTEDEPAAVLDAPEEVEETADDENLEDEPELDLGDSDATEEQDEEQPAPASDSDTGSGTKPEDDSKPEWEPATESDPAPATDDAGAIAETAAKGLDDEFLDSAPQPETKPESKPKRLSIVELVSLAIVLVAILAGAGWALKTFFADIPTRKSQTLVPDFPMRGELVTIDNATTFWREPVRSGPNQDTARRDAKLIPALELKIKDVKSDGALRVFFRDESGQLVGDVVTHAVHNGVFASTGNDQIQLAATAGFDDEGKHAAYQTAQTEPWTVEVFEGPEKGAAFENFKLLFEMPVSAERR